MVWGIVLFFLLRIASPILVGISLRFLIERWQRNRAGLVKVKVIEA